MIVQLPNTYSRGENRQNTAKMAEATARAASIRRYGEALGDPALAEQWVQTSPAAVDDDIAAWIEAGRRSAPAVEAVAAAPPRPVLDKAPLPSVLDKADEERLAKAYADKLLGCDAHDAPAWVRAAAETDDAAAAAACCASALPAREGSLEKEDVERLSKAYAAKILGCDTHDAPAWVRAAAETSDAAAAAACCASALEPSSGLEKEDVERLSKAYAAKLLGCDAHEAPAWVRAAAAADDAAAAAACCASALPASEGSLEKEDIERLSKAYAAKIACDEPYPYAARGVEQDRAPYAYDDDDQAEAQARCRILLVDAFDDDAAKERLREKGFALADDDDVEALERERCLRAFSGERSPAPAPVAT